MTTTNDHDLDRHLRLQLPRMEGQLLSGGSCRRRRCCRTTRRGFRPSRSTTRSTGCRTRSSSSGWAAQTPSPYKLTLKAPRRITHDSRLKNCGDAGRRRSARWPARSATSSGALLFQLPPNLKKDLALFDAFLDELPPKVCARVRVPPSVVARRRGLSSGWRRATSRCASPTARRCRRRCGSPPTTPTSGCATRATRRTTSSAGPTRSRARRRRAATCSCISSTKRKAKAPSSRGC